MSALETCACRSAGKPFATAMPSFWIGPAVVVTLRLVRRRELAGVVLAERAQDRRAAALVEQEGHLERRDRGDVRLSGAHRFDLGRVARRDRYLPAKSRGRRERRGDRGAARGDAGDVLRRREGEDDRTIERADARGLGSGRCRGGAGRAGPAAACGDEKDRDQDPPEPAA